MPGDDALGAFDTSAWIRYESASRAIGSVSPDARIVNTPDDSR
jgi:hypothetical protein